MFAGLHPVACGQAVSNPVDNRCEMRITACFLWIPSWKAEKQEMAGRGPCAVLAEAVEMLLPLETGTTPGTWEEPGDRPLEIGRAHV